MSRASSGQYTLSFLGTLLEIVACGKKESTCLLEEAEIAVEVLRGRFEEEKASPTEGGLRIISSCCCFVSLR